MTKRGMPPLILGGLILLILEVGGRGGLMNTSLVPTPLQVLASFQSNGSEYFQASLETLTATALGFFLAILAGLVMAFALSLTDWGRKAFLPFAVFFQTVPIIAIAPVLVVYLGFGLPTVVTSSMIVALFPVLANGLLGLRSLDPGEIELFSLYESSRWDVFWKLRLPRAYPSIYGGLKVAAGLSVIGTVAGEFVAGGGLGAMIDSARTQQRIDLVFGALVLLSGIGLFFIGLLKILNHLVNLKRPYALTLRD